MRRKRLSPDYHLQAICAYQAQLKINALIEEHSTEDEKNELREDDPRCDGTYMHDIVGISFAARLTLSPGASRRAWAVTLMLASRRSLDPERARRGYSRRPRSRPVVRDRWNRQLSEAAFHSWGESLSSLFILRVICTRRSFPSVRAGRRYIIHPARISFDYEINRERIVRDVGISETGLSSLYF